MGLSKSKAPKPGQQPGLPSQPGFPGQPQYSTQQPGLSLNPPSFPTQQPFPGPPAPQSSAFPSQAGFSLQTGFPPSQLGFSSFPSQPGFPGFQSSVFPQSTSYPVSYPSQPFRPLIPGYAPAPPTSERRSNVVQEQEQTDYVSRYYDQQMGQVPQLAQMHSGKPRKH